MDTLVLSSIAYLWLFVITLFNKGENLLQITVLTHADKSSCVKGKLLHPDIQPLRIIDGI